NTQPAALSKTFLWPTQPVVVQDDTPPRVTTLVVEPAGTVLITFSEPRSLARLGTVAKINGAAVSWTPLPEGYSVRSPRLAEGSYTLTLSTAELDLADLGLIEPYALSFDVDGERHILKEEFPPGQVATSTAGNLIGFHGLGIDEETGLMYARNRYYDPEMGRFVSIDPLGYVDGPNGYQYGLNSPGNYSDRMGLCVLGVRCRDVGSFYEDFSIGVGLDAGAMVLGALDLLTAGSIADARARADAFLSTEGTLADRMLAAQAVDQGPRLNTITLGFYGAEDKFDH
ncbi:MAG: RHS repeat-associated core domain-containing protein, partial [Thermoanaerobaculia bacterium]|nr:RHS repeat-associated core domain-containing protein [Thermoanaerobaculia bacterium]